MIIRTLFLKIFIAFWLTMALTIAVFYLMFRISNAESLPERATRGAFGETLTLYAESMVRIYEREGPQALEQYVHRAFKESSTETFLFDGEGRAITTENADSVAGVARDIVAGGPPPRTFPLFNLGVTRATWGRPVISPSGRRYIFVVRFRQPTGPPGFLTPVRIGVSILIAGLVCYLLGLYLTLPLKKLQSTVKAFAGGNLDVRVGPEIGHRHDELADLGREFDEMAERIAALISSQKRLLADISHELRSPLARLTVALELARKNTNGKGFVALDRIEQESERVNKLVGQLLALTRLESGAERVPPETVVFEELVQQVVDDASFEARPLHKEVRAIGLEQCRVRGSAELLRSAVENVVRNGIRYTAEGTAVEVTLRWHMETAVLTVRDRGPGVPEAELQHIFEPFYRVSEARERTSGGVGLGLSIAERTVKLHGGTIRAENVLGGLLVTIELPLAPVPAETRQSLENLPVT
ncbi:MAG TPA: ATP-binding protein [Candidatus Angelobacter sp.]|nr:ATP-binding protein [Candidatus Angelobacter sp.]